MRAAGGVSPRVILPPRRNADENAATITRRRRLFTFAQHHRRQAASVDAARVDARGVRVDLRQLLRVVPEDEMRGARVDLAPQRWTVSLGGRSVRIETSDVHEYARALSIHRKPWIDTGVHDTNIVFRKVEPEWKRCDEVPVVLLEHAHDFSLQRSQRRRVSTRSLAVTKQAVFVVASNDTCGDFLEQVDGAGRIGTSNDEVSDGHELIGRSEPDE